jgi:hypothetical protein
VGALTIDEEERVAGALNLYAREPDAFDEDSRTAAVAFGSYAAVAAGNMYGHQSARDMALNLQAARGRGRGRGRARATSR